MANPQTPGLGGSSAGDSDLDTGLGTGDSATGTTFGTGGALGTDASSADDRTSGAQHRADDSESGSSGAGLGDRVGSAASESKDAAQRVAHTAKDEAAGVASEAKSQARSLADRVGGELRDQASTQQSRLAGGIRTVGSDLGRMADSSESGGVASQLARNVGERADSVASWLDAREPRDVLEEVKSFARRRPGVFLAIAAGAGLVIGRLSRALIQSDDSDSSSRRDTASTRRDSVDTADLTGTGTAYSVGGTGSTYTGADAEPVYASTVYESATYSDSVGGTSSTMGTSSGAADVLGSDAIDAGVIGSGASPTSGQGDPLADDAFAERSQRGDENRGATR